MKQKYTYLQTYSFFLKQLYLEIYNVTKKKNNYNRLTKVSHSDTGTNNLTQVTEYKYDFQDLMVCRTTGSGNSAVSEYFAYDTEDKLIYTERGTVKDKTDSSFIPNFTGKLLDLNTGLYYFNARWYDPEMGRFITEDPARDGRNWFVYCRNNPLIYTDSNGKTPLLSGAIGAGIGATV